MVRESPSYCFLELVSSGIEAFYTSDGAAVTWRGLPRLIGAILKSSSVGKVECHASKCNL